MADSASYTPETVARRLAMAQALLAEPKRPITHWAEGLNELAKGLVGGRLMRGAEDMQREGEGAANAARLSLLGLGGGAAQTAVPTGAPAAPMVTPPMGNAGPPQNSAARIYSNDEPSPLDPPAGADRDQAIRTIVAEAGNQPPEGQNAVASVIRNRAVNGGAGAGAVVTAPNQFEPWNTEAGRTRMASIDPNSTPYLGAAKALDAAYAGNDPTNGAMNFFAPKAQAALGRPVPAWGSNGGQDIGDHRFFGGKGDAVANVSAALSGPQQTAQAPVADDAKAKIAAMLNSPNPYVRRQGAQLADAIVQKQLAAALSPEEYDFKTAGDTLYRTSKKKGTAEPIKDVGRGVRPMSPAEREQWKVPEGMSAGVDDNGKPVFSPSSVNVNLGGGSDKQVFDAMDESAKTARQTAAGLTGLREARQAIDGGAILGAGANERLGLQKVGALLGVANSDKIVNTETFRAAIAPQVAAVLKSTVGTANISNTDREFAEKAAGGNITLDPKSITRLLDIMERAGSAQLSAHQKRLETVYPDAEKNRRERALFGVDMPAAAVAPEATPAAGGFKILKVE